MATIFSTGSTSIKFGSVLRVGYRPNGSTAAFTYFEPYFSFDDLPAQYTIPTVGQMEVEYTEICPNCSGGIYSNAIVTVVNVT